MIWVDMVWSPVNGKSPGITSGFPAAGQDSEISLRHQHILQQSQLSNEIRNPNLYRRSLQNIMNRVGLHKWKKSWGHLDMSEHSSKLG